MQKDVKKRNQVFRQDDNTWPSEHRKNKEIFNKSRKRKDF